MPLFWMFGVCRRISFRKTIFQDLILRMKASTHNNAFAILQLSSSHDKLKNIAKITELLESASQKGATMVFLPEAADFIAKSRQETTDLAETIDGEFMSTMRGLASKLNIWISVGSMHRKPLSNCVDQRSLNTHVVIDNEGSIRGIYDKTHLFGIDMSKSSDGNADNQTPLIIQESTYIHPGQNAPVVVRDTPVGHLGLAICYDLRFPELASALRFKAGANVLAYPSAFSLPTGEAGHWHTLLRARAIETQSYVVAAAQEGVHHSKFTTYGHSLVVDPWGRIIAERSEPGPGLLMARVCHEPTDIQSDSMTAAVTSNVRGMLPVEANRRHDLFPLAEFGTPVPIGNDNYTFGLFTLKAAQLFYRTAVSMVFVNISPLVPGHVLVTPIAPVDRFNDLPAGTTADMFACVKIVSARLLQHFNATSLTISIQDGKDAGQTVPHVHIHVLPRKPGDFQKNDDIYDVLQGHEEAITRKYRSDEEMAKEASIFRKYFYDEAGRPLINL